MESKPVEETRNYLASQKIKTKFVKSNWQGFGWLHKSSRTAMLRNVNSATEKSILNHPALDSHSGGHCSDDDAL